MGLGFKEVLLGLCALHCATLAVAQQLDVKGIALGATKTQIASIMQNAQTEGGFSIGGVKNGGGSTLLVAPTFDSDEKLQNLFVLFRPKDYPAIERAFLEKYPKAKCFDSELQNAYGAIFEQRQCLVSLGHENMSVARYTQSLTTGALKLWSSKKTSADSTQEQRAKQDF